MQAFTSMSLIKEAPLQYRWWSKIKFQFIVWRQYSDVFVTVTTDGDKELLKDVT